MSGAKTDKVTGVDTTGHAWDGIEELNTPLPRWWLWTFYATILWGLVYVTLYPAWPLLNGATEGLLGYSTRGEVAAEIAAVEAQNAGQLAALEAVDLKTLADNPELAGFAVNAGRSVFLNNCSQCHGSGAAGAKGYPNLLDNDWLWGGKITQIAATVRHGIRNQEDPDARFSQMPAFGEFLSAEDIATLVAHVQGMANGAPADEGPGAELFIDNCSACHGDNGKGSRDLGAPNLVDAIWLYGSDTATLTQTVTNARFGVMPAWLPRLGEADVRAVAAYVHQLGGGE